MKKFVCVLLLIVSMFVVFGCSDKTNDSTNVTAVENSTSPHPQQVPVCEESGGIVWVVYNTNGMRIFCQVDDSAFTENPFISSSGYVDFIVHCPTGLDTINKYRIRVPVSGGGVNNWWPYDSLPGQIWVDLPQVIGLASDVSSSNLITLECNFGVVLRRQDNTNCGVSVVDTWN